MQQDVKDLETIVVDSGSTDATLSIASRYPLRILHIQPEEFSFGRSLNLACEAARGEFVIAASAHVYPVYEDWLTRLLAPFEDPKVGLVYGKQRGGETTKFSEHQVFAKWFPEQSNPNQDHPFCNNANAAVRRALWGQLPYDETLTGLEDLDWAKRAMQLGYRVAYASDAEVIHVHNESPRQTYNRYRREAIALKRIFPEERFHFGDLIRLFVGNVFSDYSQARRAGVFRKEFAGIPTFRLMQFWGTYRGYAQRGPVTTQLRQTFYYPQSRTRLAAEHPSSPTEARRRVQYSTNPEEPESD
jgi:glycosyltransferase involved in cell wall biosynthesis